jgi:transposase
MTMVEHKDAACDDLKDSGDTQRYAPKVVQLHNMVASMLNEGRAEQAMSILLDVIDELQRDNERLGYRLAASIRARYGRRSEKLTAEQLGQLVLAWGGTEKQAGEPDPDVPTDPSPTEEGVEEPTPAKRRRKRRGKQRRPKHHGRTQLDPSLPRVVTTIRVPDDDRKCIHCHVPMDTIDYVDHETVEYVPARIEVHVERREKLACKNKTCGQDIATAPRENSRAYERRAGASLLAHLVESKCDDALPVYRQHDQLRRLGFFVPLNTLYGYWSYATALLMPLADVIRSTVLGSGVVGVDDTKLDYLDPADPRGRQRGHLWCFVGEGALVAFGFTETWSAKDVDPWISAIDGFIQCDDYKGYGAALEDGNGGKRILVPPHRRLGCMMHVRRRFHSAFTGGHLPAAVPLKLIKDIYAVEEHAKTDELGPEGRLALRTEKSLPLLNQLDGWVDENLPKFRPKSPLATAASYSRDQRPFVRRCFSDGRFEIDNGRVEREIREPALGRKNFLFAGSAKAAERLAAAYTVVLSARHVGLPVREYLIDVITKLERGWKARRIAELMPDRWEGASQANDRTPNAEGEQQPAQN